MVNREKKLIVLDKVPEQDIKDGLLCIFDKADDGVTKRAFADIVKGQTEYAFPEDKRNIVAFYIKLPEEK